MNTKIKPTSANIATALDSQSQQLAKKLAVAHGAGKAVLRPWSLNLQNSQLVSELANSQSSLKKPKWLSWGIVMAPIVSCAILMMGLGSYFYMETQRPVTMRLQNRSVGHPINDPINLDFNQSLKDVSLEIAPSISGRWETKRDLLGIKKATFYPDDKKLAAATQYRVKVVDAEKVALGKPMINKEIDLITEFAPGVVSVSPMRGLKNTKINQSVNVVFSSPQDELHAPRLISEPEVELIREVSNDRKTFTWHPKTTWAQTTTYEVSAQKQDGSKLVETSFATVNQPNITSATNKNYFYPEEKMVVSFDTSMKTDKPAINCQCKGEGSWSDSQTYTFMPSELQPGNSYAYTVPKGLLSESGGVRETDQNYAISTPGAVQLSVGSQQGVGLRTSVQVTFDQAVKRESLQSRLSVSPQAEIAGISWRDDKTAVVTLSNMDYQTTYNLSVAAGVEPLRFGLPSNAARSGTITTVPPTVKLNVPYFRQAHSVSCEEASLRMALAYRGINTTDLEILQRVGYSPRPLDRASNTWEDPNQMFVGDINGTQAAKTGYGVYAPPIAKAARSFGRNATASVGVSANYLAQAIHDGNPVVIWGSYKRAGPTFSWNTPEGGVATGWINQHAKTLFGVVGKPAAPVGFYIHDPISGTHYLSTAQLMADLNVYGNLTNQAVVVY